MPGGLGIAPRVAATLSGHRPFALVLLLVSASRLPFYAEVHALVVLNQDLNPEHFGRLFLEGDLPLADPSEVGENARTLSFASMYFWLPLLLFRLGVPFDFSAGLHALLVLPLACFAMYRLALALFRDERVACLAVLVFLFKDFALFRLNLGYPLQLNRTVYYSDANVIFVLFALDAMVRRRLVAASAWIGGLTLCNPVSMATLSGCFVFYLLLAGRLRRPDRDTALSLAIIAVGALLAFLAVSAATPVRNPAPGAARTLAILGNAHFNPHVNLPLEFLALQTLLIAGLAYAGFVEKNLGQQGAARTSARHLACAVCAAYVFFGWILYWLLFVTAPVLLAMTVPSKIYAVAATYIAPYIAYALYRILQRRPLVTLLVLAFVAILVMPETVRSWIGVAAAIALACGAAASFFWLGRDRSPERPTSAAWLYAIMAILAYDFIQSSTKIFRSGELAAARAFYQIQLQIKAAIPRDAMFTAYRYPGAVVNSIGPFRNWAFRTYSRRGAIPYWLIGRNIYFDSAQVHQVEMAGFAAFGVDAWNAVLREAENTRRASPLLYYTGLRWDGLTPRLQPTAISTIFGGPYNELKEKISRMSLEEFKRGAAVLGATHVIVNRDPGMGSELAGLLQNDYFVVVAVR